VGRELDYRSANGTAARAGSNPSSPSAGRGDGLGPRRRGRGGGVRFPADCGDAWTGRGVLRRRRGARWGVDRLKDRRLEGLQDCSIEFLNPNPAILQFYSSASLQFINPAMPLYGSEVFRDVVEVALGVDRGHAARSGGGNGLPVDVILDVAAGEHT